LADGGYASGGNFARAQAEGREVRAFVRRDADNPERLRAIPVPDDIKALCS
jgi:hypothetical protein